MRKTFSVFLGVLLIPFSVVGVAGAQPPDPAHQPVVFVHGYSGSASDWNTAESTFRQAGYGEHELFAFEYDWAQSNVRSAEDLASFVDAVLRLTGAEEVDIVNHSMGGLVSGWYAKKLGGIARIDDWASLAGANHGTTTANTCTIFPSCREMLPDSVFLRQLNSGAEAPTPVRWSTWYSPADGVIIPYESTALEGADNHEVAGVSHLEFPHDPDVLDSVVRTLRN